MKICSKCKIEKDVSEFSIDKKSNDGLQYKCKECDKKYYIDNRNQRLKYHKDNKEHINKQSRKWRLNNKEHINKYYKKRCCIPEYDKKRAKKQYQNNPDKYKHANKKRRALKNNAEGLFTEKEFEQQLQLYHYKCLKCGADLRKAIIHHDHIKPLSIGGSNYIENIQPLCQHCNCSKHTDWIDYKDNWLQHYAI